MDFFKLSTTLKRFGEHTKTEVSDFVDQAERLEWRIQQLEQQVATQADKLNRIASEIELWSACSPLTERIEEILSETK